MADAAKYNLELLRRFDLWLSAMKYEPNTHWMYSHAADEFSTFLGNKSFTRANYVDVLEYLAAIGEMGCRSRRTVRGYLHGLRIFYDFLDFAGFIREHAPRMIHMKAIPRKIPVVLSEKKISRLIKSARNPRDRVIAELLYSTGCRSCELTRIKVEDIDFDENRIRVFGKIRPRVVLFGLSAKRAIRAYLRGRQHGYLIDDGIPKQRGNVMSAARRGWHLSWRTYTGPHEYKIHRYYIPVGRNMSRQEARAELRRLTKNVDLSRPLTTTPKSTDTIRKAIKAMAAIAGIPWANPSMIRHTFATHLLEHDANLRVIQDLMGHASIRATEIYTHVCTKQLRRTYKRYHPLGKSSFHEKATNAA